MNRAQYVFWNDFYMTARRAGCTPSEAERFADAQLAKFTR